MIDWSWKIKTETILALVIAALIALCVLSITLPLLVIDLPVQVEKPNWQARYHEAVKAEERALEEVEIWQACCLRRHQLHSETLRQLGLDKPPLPGIKR